MTTPATTNGQAADRRAARGGALPAWPVSWLFVLYPLVWLGGLTPFALPVVGLACLFLMALRGRIRLPPLWLPWVGYLFWTLVSAVMIDSAGRFLGFAQRWSALVGASLIALYVYNAPERLPRRRVLGALSWFMLWVAAGGYLGLVKPYGRISTPMLALMPRNVAANEYVRELLSPRFAEVQTPYGADAPFVRPAAPFPYTNGWGHAFVLLLPLMAALAVSADRRMRVTAALLAVAAVPPALATLNRGIFVGIFVASAAVLWRYRSRVRLGHVLLAAVPLGLFAVGVVASGAVDRIGQRTSTSSTTADRASIYREAFDRTLGSPLLGYGAPRPSSTLDVSVGTQGHFWYVMFSHGFVGLVLFLTTIWGLALVTRRTRDLPTALMHTTLVVVSVMLMFYGLDGMNLLIVLLTAVVLLRDDRPARPGARPATGAPDRSRSPRPFAATPGARA
ncbi:MAG: O-antigen ligase family protein [Kineosporiaceae bacterium]